MYWIPKLHKNPYKARFIANSSACTTTHLSKLLTSCLTAVKCHVIRYCEKVYENSGMNLFWSIKNSGEVIDKLRCQQFQASSLSTYDFSTLYTSLPHELIKNKMQKLIQSVFARENTTFLACNKYKAFFTNSPYDGYTMWSCTDVCHALVFILDNIFIQHDNHLYQQVVGIPMGTNCAPLIADLFLYCYERDFMLSLSPSQVDVIQAFNRTSRYLDDILNIDNPFFSSMVTSIYPSQLKLTKANLSDTETSFLDLHLSIDNGTVTSKIYDKRDDFSFDIVNYPHLDGDVPRRTSYGVYVSQLVRFARACNNVSDFTARNQTITGKLLKQGYRYHKLCRSFAKFYRRNADLVGKYNTSLKSLLQDGVAQPEYYGDVYYRLRKIKGSSEFSDRFTKLIRKYIGMGYNPLILRRTACLLVDPFTVNQYAFLFSCAMTGQCRTTP